MSLKIKDLVIPFGFDQRKPYLFDQVFYVPAHYADHHQFSFPLSHELFCNQNPVCVEYCSGNGDWIVNQAIETPFKNWIAVEKRLDRVRKIWVKLKRSQLTNVLVVCGEAYTFTHHYVHSHTIDEVYIHFPDPWPKGRHAKHRLLQEKFLDELARILVRGKGVTFVSDDTTYLHHTLNVFQKHACFQPSLPHPYFKTEKESYGDSWFEKLWREKGKEILSTRFIKHADSH
jgi:tRNA (guanine-N7-)-methyltransferase